MRGMRGDERNWNQMQHYYKQITSRTHTTYTLKFIITSQYNINLENVLAKLAKMM
jgi:hypothetical protein